MHIRHFSLYTMRVMVVQDRPRIVCLALYSRGWDFFPRLTAFGLMICSKRVLSEHPEELNEIVWGRIEDNFQHTKGDVLEIFDW